MAKTPKLTNDDILDIVNAELENAPVNNNLETPLAYYLGEPNGTEVEGKSSLMSLDVADAIEWIMPQIMKSFTQTNEIVIFDPCGPEDERQAELESEYVYNILMKKNTGFISIHQFVKDALLQRNGILKVYYESNDQVTKEAYTGLTEQQLQMLLSDKTVELLSMEQIIDVDPVYGQQVLFNVKIQITIKKPKIRVMPVPPEEFRVNSSHNSIDLTDARFTAHITQKTVSQLREDGVSEDILDELSTGFINQSDYRFQLQGENSTVNEGWTKANDAMRLIQVAECYLYIDIDGDGIAEYVKVTCAGNDTFSTFISMDEMTESPWISATAILMSHKFQGLSIFDRLKEIQDNKTALVRNIQDNIYLQNNQRMGVLTGQVNMDDLLVSRPGGVVRMSRPDAIFPIITPKIGIESFEFMRYLDEVRAGRSGVSAEGSATPQNIGDRVGSQGVERLMTAKEELVGLIVRVFAETGIKPLCLKIRDLARRHVDTIENFKFRGEWVQVNPAQWNERSESTVRVGTGSGDTTAKLAAINQVIQMQTQALQMPGQAIVDPTKIYTALNDFCKFSGLNGADKYFIDPSSDTGKQKQMQSDQQMQGEKQKADQQNMAMVQMQVKLADAEMLKAQAAQENVMLKGQVEKAKHQREMDKQTYEARMAQLESQVKIVQQVADAQEKDEKLEFDYNKLAADIALKITELEAQYKQQALEQEYNQNKGATEE
jgi:hypothetical protein